MLRIFVFSLLLANILLIAFRMLQPDADESATSGRVVQPDGTLPTIELVEPDPADVPTAAAPSSQETNNDRSVPEDDTVLFKPEQESMECIQIGPFKSRQSYAGLKSELDATFERVLDRESKTLVDKGFWVFLPRYPTRDAAEAVTRQLSSAGVREFYVVPTGAMANAISLGVYDRRERAEARRDQLSSLGLNLDFMIEPQTEIETSFWLEAGPVKLLNPALIGLSYNNPDTRQTRVECSSDFYASPPGAGTAEPGPVATPENASTGQN